MALDHIDIAHHQARMFESVIDFWDMHPWGVVAASAVIVTGVSIFADRRRAKRAHIDSVGFMPWTGISVLSTLVAVLAIALTLKTEFM